MNTSTPAAPIVAVASILLVFAIAPCSHAANGVKAVATPQRGQPIVARTDSQGTIHLLYHSVDGPQYSKSVDNGESFSKAIPLVDPPSRRPKLEFTICDMAVQSNGRIHVALSSNAWVLKLPREEWGFYYSQLAPGGEAFTPLRNINGKPSEGYSIAADDEGRITACWLSGKLYANVSRDNGETFGPTVEIDSAINPCDCCTTTSVYAADGKLAVLYREETANERDMYLVLWDQDHNQAARTRVSESLWKIDACPMTYFSLARAQDGFVAAWPTKGQVYFARIDGGGHLPAPGEIKTPGSTGMRIGLLALSNPQGSSLVAWKELGELRWQLYDPTGRPLGRRGSAASAGSGVAGIVDRNGDFLLFR